MLLGGAGKAWLEGREPNREGGGMSPLHDKSFFCKGTFLAPQSSLTYHRSPT